MITKEEVRAITEEQLKKFNLKHKPEVTKVHKGSYNWFIRIMWGFENEGIEIQVLLDMPDRIFGDAVQSKIAKDLNDIKCYDKRLYDKIVE